MTDLYNPELIEESRRLIQQSRELLDLGKLHMAQSRMIIDEAQRVIAAVADRMADRAIMALYA
jgi:hypothetical protein